MATERLHPERLARPKRAYTPVIRSGDSLYVSGQVPVADDGTIVTGDAATQAAQVLRNVSTCLEAGGGTVSDVVAMTVYLTDITDIDAIDVAFRDLFPDGMYPTRTTVQIAALGRPEFRVEISAVAAIAAQGAHES
jgi:2-iminobutanoate/2-iminopropanoate deaminase